MMLSPPRSGIIYRPQFLSPLERKQWISYLLSLRPIWEMRYSQHNPPPPGDSQRPLLRPVYWLGNWQFACLGYYHPPLGILHRSLYSTPFPALMSPILKRIEKMVYESFAKEDIPKGWELNTCLINYYGDRLNQEGKWEDQARVGEHKDYEPGPVASLSFGERALFQFVSGAPDKKTQKKKIFWEGWIADNGLQIFGGSQWKDHTFHRVQRVERKLGQNFEIGYPEFRTRRINLTFRFVPREHWCWLKDLSPGSAKDIQEHVNTLSKNCGVFRQHLL